VTRKVSGIIFQFAFIFILQTTIVCAKESYLVQKQPDVKIVYPESLQAVIPDIVDAFNRAKTNLHNIFSWPISKRVRLIIINNRSKFFQIAEHPLTVAFAEPSRNRITINYQDVIVNPFSLETTLQHELCHLLLGEHMEMHIPRWLNEGIAQWASEGITEIFRPEKNILQKAAFSGTIIPFYRLENSFPIESNAFVLAYEQSQSFVTFLVQQYSKYSFLQALELMKSGHSLHDSMRTIYGKSLHQLEHEWVVSQTQFLAWVLFVINNFYTFLFAGLSVISIIGFIRMKRKKWQYPDDWDDDLL
jgi:hypothetical protein